MNSNSSEWPVLLWCFRWGLKITDIRTIVQDSDSWLCRTVAACSSLIGKLHGWFNSNLRVLATQWDRTGFYIVNCLSFFISVPFIQLYCSSLHTFHCSHLCAIILLGFICTISFNFLSIHDQFCHATLKMRFEVEIMNICQHCLFPVRPTGQGTFICSLILGLLCGCLIVGG